MFLMFSVNKYIPSLCTVYTVNRFDTYLDKNKNKLNYFIKYIINTKIL